MLIRHAFVGWPGLLQGKPDTAILRLAQAWHLQLDVHALDHDGNLLDACMLSALAALMAFRRPDTEVAAAGGEGASSTVTLLSPDVREPLPLSLHQLPLAITFALFEVVPILQSHPVGLHST